MAGDSNVSLKMQPGGNAFVSRSQASLFIYCYLPLKTRPRFPLTAQVLEWGCGPGSGTQKSNCRWDAEDYLALQTSQSFFFFDIKAPYF